MSTDLYMKRIKHILSRNMFINELCGYKNIFPDDWPTTFNIQNKLCRKKKIQFTISEDHFNIIHMLNCCLCGKQSMGQNINCVNTILVMNGFVENNCLPFCKTCSKLKSGLDLTECIYKMYLSYHSSEEINMREFNLLVNSFIKINLKLVNRAINMADDDYAKKFAILKQNIINSKKKVRGNALSRVEIKDKIKVLSKTAYYAKINNDMIKFIDLTKQVKRLRKMKPFGIQNKHNK